MRLMFDCSYPIISHEFFNEYDWFCFYRGAKEAIPPNMHESRGHEVSISVFVDADLSGDKYTRRSQTGVLICINKASVYWYRKRQATF